MSAKKSERLLNLLIMLLVQRRPVPKHRIRAALYPDTVGDAFDKMFERDKDELRALGVPVELASVDAVFDEPGYLVRSDEFLVPDLQLEADEAAILAVAGRVWQHARFSADTRAGLQKLAALGVDVDENALEVALPQLAVEEPAFEVFWDASQHRIPLRFDYARPGQDPVTRTVEPWGVVRSSGRWYLVGHDRDRSAQRTFRLSRVVGEPTPAGKPGSYTVPPEADLRAVAERLAPPNPDVVVTVLLRPERGHQIRRQATRTELDVTGGPGSPDEPWDRVEFVAHRSRVIETVLLLGADAVLVEPADLREELVRRLRSSLPTQEIS